MYARCMQHDSYDTGPGHTKIVLEFQYGDHFVFQMAPSLKAT